MTEFERRLHVLNVRKRRAKVNNGIDKYSGKRLDQLLKQIRDLPTTYNEFLKAKKALAADGDAWEETV